MRRRRIHRPVAGLTSALLAATLGGCTPGAPSPEPSPTPQPAPAQYGPIEEDYCEHAELDLVLVTFDLDSIYTDNRRPSIYEPRPDSGRWSVLCYFNGNRTDDDRSRTEATAGGTVEATVYADPAEALANYEQAEGWPRVPQSQVRPDNTRVLEGPWDEGRYIETLGESQSDLLARPSTSLSLDYHIVHTNLVVRVKLGAEFEEEGTAEPVGLAHEIANTLLTEAIDHVPPATDQ